MAADGNTYHNNGYCILTVKIKQIVGGSSDGFNSNKMVLTDAGDIFAFIGSRVTTQIPVPDNKKVTYIDIGNEFYLCETDDGSVYMWGERTQFHQCCDVSSTEPKLVQSLTNIPNRKKFSLGGWHSMLLASGKLYAWGKFAFITYKRIGYNRDGRCGNPNKTDIAIPTEVVYNDIFIDVHAATFHTCALTRSFQVLTWGSNHTLALGNMSGSVCVPTKVTFFNDKIIRQIFVKDQTNFAIEDNGSVYAWGSNANKKLGIDSKNTIGITKMDVDGRNIVNISILVSGYVAY